MDKVSIRLTEEEKGLLREQAEAAGMTLSELIRDRLFPQNLAGTPATFGQAAELSRQVTALQEQLNFLAAERETCTEVRENQPHAAQISGGENDLRLEKMERELAGLAQNLSELKQLFLERKPAPSGLLSLWSRRG